MSAEDRYASSDHFQTTTANDPWNAWRALLLSGVHHSPSLPDFLSAAYVSEESGANRRSRFRVTPGKDPHAATQIEAMKAHEPATSHDWPEKRLLPPRHLVIVMLLITSIPARLAKTFGELRPK